VLLPQFDENLIDLLTSFQPTLSKKNEIFCVTDQAIIFVDNFSSVLGNYWKIFKSDRYDLEYLMDKSNMIQFAKAAGFKVPFSIALERGQEIAGEAIERLPLPCIVKPVNSLKGGKELFEIVNDRDRVSIAAKNLLLKVPKIIIQEYIEYDETGGVWEAFAFRTQRRSCVLSIKKERQYPDKKGSSSFIRTKALPCIYDPVSRFLALVEFNGIVDFEFIEQRSKYYFIEINFRPGTPIGLSQRSGMNMPVLILNNFAGDVRDDFDGSDSIYWLRDTNDWRHVLEGRISVWKFIRNVFQTHEFLIFSLQDLRPFLFFLKLISRAGVKKLGENFFF
jgi:predicted ATP-grasp superfamily ATP-dependent carboligase